MDGRPGCGFSRDPCALDERGRDGLGSGLGSAKGFLALEELDELEERLETEYALGSVPMLCVWYTCPDVCPTGG